MNRPRLSRKTDVRPVVRAMLAVLGLALPLGVIAAGRISAIEKGYALGRLQAEELALERDNEKLTLEVSTLRAPARLERLAREKLHMAAPGSGDLLLEGGGPPSGPLVRAVAERR
jgi:cell division protein FtsL